MLSYRSLLALLATLSGITTLTLAAALTPGFVVDNVTPLAFQQPLPGLDAQARALAARGRGLFNQLWVSSPSRDAELDGLGPTYNQSGCGACHLRNGRGSAPAGPTQRLRGMLVRLSVVQPDGGAAPHPVYGDQLQEAAILGVPAEGRVVLSWVEEMRVLADGTEVGLRYPLVRFAGLNFGELGAVQLSLRVAPQLVGAGLLDAVTATTLAQLAATPRPDGIQGQINQLKGGVGRFGWKANMTDLTQQSAAAFSGDLGLTSSLFPVENCPPVQLACANMASATLDVSDAQLEAVVFYQAALAVPAPRDQRQPHVQKGRELFHLAGCQHCHLPTLQSGPVALLPQLANQRFAAYTDLLLHDMGAGLADDRADGQASGQQWRTAPLWGLGLVPVVSEHRQLLHDGRARNVLEAILWHGGEAAVAAERVSTMSRSERNALEAFVLSL